MVSADIGQNVGVSQQNVFLFSTTSNSININSWMAKQAVGHMLLGID